MQSLKENLDEALKNNTFDTDAPDLPKHGLDVFISYSSLNKNVADAVVSDFEQNGIRCWYAPRDIMPGQEWVTAIHEAINACQLFVLIYTDSSNESKQVANEVALAFNSGKTLIPFRLSATEMSSELEYYLTRVHWLDAVNPPLLESITNLRKYSKKILEGNIPKESKIRNSNSTLKKSVPVYWLYPVIVILIALMCIAIILLIKGNKDDEGGKTYTALLETTDKKDVTDVPLTETPTPETMLTDTPTLEATETPTPETAVTETPTPETTETDTPTPETTETPIPETAVTETPTPETKITETPTPETALTDAPVDDITGEVTSYEPDANELYNRAYSIQTKGGEENRYEEAYELYLKTGDAVTDQSDIAEAMYLLGLKFCNGDDVSQDYEKGIKLFEKSASSGYLSACNQLGTMYLTGMDIDQDLEKALSYFEYSASKENAIGLYSLACMYENGQGVEADIDKAIELYKKAADLDHREAKTALRRLEN